MKKATVKWFPFLLTVFLFTGFLNLNAQERIIEPTEGFVNEIIKADTAADGTQAHTTYIFRRDQQYYYNGQINNLSYAITLKAEDGTGRKPMILNYPDGAAKLNRFIMAGNDVYMYNLYIDGMGLNTTTFEPDPLYTMAGQLVNAAASGKEFIVDGCVLNNAGQVLIRSNSGARKVQVTNTVLANSGQLSADNMGNGRIIDFRNGATDTVIFRNCTMVNTLDRIVRHYGAAANATTALIKYFEMDHNTIVHNAGAFGYLMLGDIADVCKITNNLMYNPVTLGSAEKDTARLAEVTVLAQPDVNGKYSVPLIIDQPNTNVNPSFTIANNVIVYDDAVEQFFAANSLSPSPVLTPRLAGKVSGVPYTNADITLANIPATMTTLMNWYQSLAVQSTGGGMITTTEVDMDRRTRTYWTDSLNCYYSTTSGAFLGNDGKPVGSLVWGSKVNIEVAEPRILEPTEGFVNEIIKADTTASGAQAHTTYIFRRDQQYYFNGQINNLSYPITLKAEEGSGRKPMLLNYPDGAAKLNRFILAGNDAYIYNLYIDGMGLNTTTFEPDPLYTMNGQLLNAGASGKEFIVDGCVLNNAAQVLIRSNSGARKVQVTNTILSNSGQLSADNMGNGRIIDFRNGATDTVIFRNCTMVNTLDRIVRHYGAAANATTALIKYFEMDHNTIVHNAGAFGYLMLGDIADVCKITNNLMYNPVTLGGGEKDTARLVEIQVLQQPDVNGKYVVPLMIDQPNTNVNPSFTIANNVVAYDDAVEQFFAANGLSKSPALTPRLSGMVSGTTITEADVALANIPATMTTLMNWYQALAVQSTGGGMITTTEVDMDRRTRTYWTDSLNCSYTTDNAVFKGTDGQPVGSLVWNSVITGVEDVEVIPAAYALSSNYPNPFNPSTKINFSLPVKSNISIVVFNILGQEVTKLAQGEFEAGNHSVTFNAEGLGSGIYIYKLSAAGSNGQNFTSTQKMTLLK